MYASEIGDELTFKRIVVFELEDKTAEGYGRVASKSLRNNISDSVRFEIMIPEEQNIPSSRKEAIKIGRKLKADAVIHGNSKIEENILKISLEMVNVKNDSTFATESKWIKGKLTLAPFSQQDLKVNYGLYHFLAWIFHIKPAG